MRLIEQERGWNSKAISPKGAIGQVQLMLETALPLGFDPRVPATNLDDAARYLKTQYRAFRSWRLALAAYKAGPCAARANNGVSPYAEIRKYIAAILKM